MERLITPEAVALELPTATAATRALGRLLDVVLQYTTLTVVLAATSVADASDVVIIVVGLVAALLVRIAYPIALETRWGATLGQRAMGLQIVTTDGAPIRARQALVRAAVGLLEVELTFGLLAFVVAASRKDGRRIGDLAAGTLAVSVRVGTGRADVLDVECPPALRGWATTLDVAGLGPRQRGVLRRYHTSAPSLAPERGRMLATQLATRLLDELSATAPAGATPQDVLSAIAWAGSAAGRDDRGGDEPRQSPAAAPPPPPAPPTSSPVRPPSRSGGGGEPATDAGDSGTSGGAGFAPPT